MEPALSVVVLVGQHRQFGWTASVWETEEPEPGRPALKHRVTWDSRPPKPSGLTPTDQDPVELVSHEDQAAILNEVILLSKTISEHEILRRFASQDTLLKDFLRNLSEDKLVGQIRPYIDRQLDKLFRLVMDSDIPVYMHDNTPRLYPANQVSLQRTPVEPWFCFTRRPDGSDYVLELLHEDKKLVLNTAGNTILCNNPCWFRSGSKIFHFPDGFDGKKIKPFLTRESILIPTSAEKKYFETFILKTLKTGQVRADGFSVRQLTPARRAELSLENDWQGQGVLILYFRYGDKRILAGKVQKVFIDLTMEAGEVCFYKTERDFGWEKEMMAMLGSLGLVKINESTLGLVDEKGHLLNIHDIVEWLGTHAEELTEREITVKTDRAPGMFFIGRTEFNLNVFSNEDWFDIVAEVTFGDYTFPFVYLRDYILNGIREFRLPSGETAVIPVAWFTRYEDLLYFSTTEKNTLKLPARHFRLVSGLTSLENKELRQRIDLMDFRPGTPESQPTALQTQLRPYQAEGLQWLRFLHLHRFGGCLADDMGLGKTIQALALLLAEKPDPHRASLIVMPASLIHNWRNEIRRFAPSIRVMEHSGMNRVTTIDFFNAVDVILASYGTVRNDLELFTRYRFHYVILDESQMIKNPSAQVSRAVCRLESDHRLVLTGTPIENSLTDLWSQMEFLNPGFLGSLAGFQRRYRGTQIESMRLHSESEVKSVALADPNDLSVRLKNLIAPFIMRRTKKEVEPDLPPLTIEEVLCEMAEEQRIFYEKENSAVRNEVLEKLESGSPMDSSLSVLKALIRLRQTANHPLLINPGYQGGSGKFEEIIRMALTLFEENNKVLIFSSFVKHLKLVADSFSQEGIEFAMLTGATTRREQVVGKFRNEEVPFFLISLKAGGTGLNLSEASYVMMLDPWWNPASELQAISRAHRIGQDKKVIAYKFISIGTIEEKIVRLQQRKQQLTNDFVPSGNPLKDMTREEMRELFR